MLPGTGRVTGSRSRSVREGILSRSVRRRVLSRAARAWSEGYPHGALMILTEAGMADVWPEFRDAALRRARTRYIRLMTP